MPLVEGGGLRVTPAEVNGLAGEVGQALQTAAQLRPDQALGGAAAAVPGSQLDPACQGVTTRWSRELRDLNQALSYLAEALRGAAGEYTRTEQSVAQGFGSPR